MHLPDKLHCPTGVPIRASIGERQVREFVPHRISQRDSYRCTLTVIMPVYNEESTLAQQLQRVAAVFPDKEIIVVDDGSTDGSALVLNEWKERDAFLVLRHSTNLGKGAAIRTALPHARGRLTIIQDADLETNPQEFERLVEPLLSGRADAVYGSRYLHSEFAKYHWDFFRLGVSALNLAVRVLYGQRLTDEATCYKVFPTEILRQMNLECKRFEFCPEVTAKACRLGLRILEVPIDYSPRSVRDGKKLRLVDGWAALAALWRWRSWEVPKEMNAISDRSRDLSKLSKLPR